MSWSLGAASFGGRPQRSKRMNYSFRLKTRKRCRRTAASIIGTGLRGLSAIMNKLIGGIVIGALLTASIYGLVHVMLDESSAPDIPQDILAQRRTGMMDLICELQLDLDGQLALGINANEPARMSLAQIDFDRKSGWYQGRLAISEGRAGNLTVVGPRLIVSRPAMFQRFGVTISKEDFVIDRSNGSFTQSISTQDGRTITLIRGTCAQVIKPPF